MLDAIFRASLRVRGYEKARQQVSPRDAFA